MAKRNPKDDQLVQAFAKNVRNYREMRGLSMQELANIADVHKGAIYLIENARTNTTISTAGAIARALQVTVNDLLAEETGR